MTEYIFPREEFKNTGIYTGIAPKHQITELLKEHHYLSKINNGFRQRFADGYKPENLCLHWYDIFKNISNVRSEDE